MDEKFDPKKTGGISANTIVVPIAVVILILHIMVIFLILSISVSSGNLSAIMRDSGNYTQEATSLIAGSSLLSETSTNFVLMPETEKGAVNVSPLTAYAEELSKPRRGAEIVEKFHGFNVSSDVIETIEDAAGSADYMLQNQLHAITLMRTMYEVPDTEPYNTIPTVELTEKESKMSDEEKMALAKELVLGSEYALNKQNVSEKVNLCVKMIQEDAGKEAAVTGKRISVYRTLLWVSTLLIIVILTLAFFTLYSQVIMPLRRFAALIPAGEKLDETKGSREVRLVAAAYNSASRRRDSLDEILRKAAEKDPLTNLPNRYRYEQYKLELEESSSSAAVVLFDIDYLKQTNDEFGHRAGDRLIRDAAECIVTAFGDREGDNCFRVGGDEFVAVVENCTPREVNEMIDQFREEQKVRRISISLGYAYTDNVGNTTIKNLLSEADRRMYEFKKESHDQRSHDQEADDQEEKNEK